MRVLVTGGAGFIGSHLVKALEAEGARALVLDNLSTGSRTNLAGCSAELVVGDVTDFDLVSRVVAGSDLIFHQAALVSVPYSIENPALTYRTNVTGTFNVFEAARRMGVGRVVYASSSAVYGDSPGLPKHEADVLAPITPYAATKQMNEVLAAAYMASYDMVLVGLRYMNVFGPRQDPSSPYSGVLSIFCQALIRSESCTIYGDGEQTRDFVYVADVVQANLLAAKVPVGKIRGIPIFNVGRGQQTSLNQIVDLLGSLAKGEPLAVAYADARVGDIKYSVADINRARTMLGYRPETKMADGLRKTLEWFRSQGSGA